MQRALDSAHGVAEVHARRGLGVFYEREWRLNAAQAQLEAAAAAASSAQQLHLLASVQADLGRVLLKRGDVKGASDVLEQASQQGFVPPGQVGVSANDLWRLRGDAAKAGGRYEESSSHYKEARKVAVDADDVARLNAAECDLFQLQRRLGAARVKCDKALARQTLGHPERPATLKTLGLIYYFGGDPKRALGLHTRAMEAYAALGNHVQAAWMREFVIDDRASIVEEDPSQLSPLIAELEQLIDGLHQGYPLQSEGAHLLEDETLWWRVSDAQLRLADMLRKQHRFDEAERAVAAGQTAFEKRPEGFKRVPDYATVFELKGLIALEQGRLGECRGHFASALQVLEGIIGSSVDVTYLKQEIVSLDKKIAGSDGQEEIAGLEVTALV